MSDKVDKKKLSKSIKDKKKALKDSKIVIKDGFEPTDGKESSQ